MPKRPLSSSIAVANDSLEPSTVHSDSWFAAKPIVDLTPIELQIPRIGCVLVKGERLDKVLAKLIPQFSRTRIGEWIELGLVELNGAPCTLKKTIYGGEKVRIQPQADPESAAFQAEDIPLNIVYEDADLMIINKPAGMVVHPAGGHWSGTLVNAVLHHYPASAGLPRAGIVHRLDKDTTGLMVVAKTLVAQTHLVRQLQARTVKRQYLALVHGTITAKGTVNAAIARHPRERNRMHISPHAAAKPARTHWRVLAQGLWQKTPVSLLECQLETGRTHQIRLHMQHIGHPLIGEPVYTTGGKNLSALLPRQALHAFQLGLIHPSTGQAMRWVAPIPDDLIELMEQLNIYLEHNHAAGISELINDQLLVLQDLAGDARLGDDNEDEDDDDNWDVEVIYATE
jgi:23S rRNA pseudouridine1911/1915/1917 synthase